jgi:PST family polysaccharide transporter
LTRSEHDELDTKIMRSSAWALLGFGGLNVASLLTTIVLARLLEPRDFGIVALALAVLAVAQIAQESGLGAALIVYRGDVRVAAASVSVFAPVVSIVLYGTAFAVAPLVAHLLDEPRLQDVVRVLALVLVLRGFSITPISLLQRQMKFRSITAIELAGGLTQSLTAIVLAAMGAGLWSLVAGQIGLGLAQAVLAWVLAPIRPSPLELQTATLRELMRFGRYVGIANFVNYAHASADSLVVGRMLGAGPLGYFSIAKRFATLPTVVIGNILGRGVYPALAQLQGDREGSRRVWLENVQRVALLSVPTTIGLVFVADPLVETMFGARWLSAAPVLQILALVGVVQIFSRTYGEVFQALRRPQLRVAAEVSHLVLLIPALVAGARFGGIEGVAAGILAVNLVVGLPFIGVVMRELGATVRDVTHAIGRPALGWGLMTLSLCAVYPLVKGLPPSLELLTTATCGAVVYGVAVAVFARKLVHDMWRSLRGVQTAHLPRHEQEAESEQRGEAGDYAYRP